MGQKNLTPSNSEIESFFGSFEEESDEWGVIEQKIYKKRLQLSGRKVNSLK